MFSGEAEQQREAVQKAERVEGTGLGECVRKAVFPPREDHYKKRENNFCLYEEKKTIGLIWKEKRENERKKKKEKNK